MHKLGWVLGSLYAYKSNFEKSTNSPRGILSLVTWIWKVNLRSGTAALLDTRITLTVFENIL